MKIVANIIWLVFAGIWLFLGYVISGILNCIFIITIPFGVQAFKLAGFALWPFGRTAVPRPGASAAGSGCGNILWFVLGGWYMALLHFITGLVLCIFIITIPFAIQDFKLAGLSLAPFGKEIVSNAEALRRRAYYNAGATTGWQSPSTPPPAGASSDQNNIAF